MLNSTTCCVGSTNLIDKIGFQKGNLHDWHWAECSVTELTWIKSNYPPELERKIMFFGRNQIRYSSELDMGQFYMHWQLFLFCEHGKQYLLCFWVQNLDHWVVPLKNLPCIPVTTVTLMELGDLKSILMLQKSVIYGLHVSCEEIRLMYKDTII